ncbi:hypothetical protein PG985_011198 [Apiospora marii]|uniref:uncharacterized protein n=1 Tax=Apiospora marii TaxID=335849 RepID=UPI003131889E
MAERKVPSKYYPPDFDPQQISRRRQPKRAGPKLQPSRFGAPFTICCLSCCKYIGQGKRFNARKETRQEDKYLGGIQIFRFHIRCPWCLAPITFKTDPKREREDYICESGAMQIRGGPRRTAEEETDEQRLVRLAMEEGEGEEDLERDTIAELETKAADTKRDMAVADALEERRIRNARIERLCRSRSPLSTAATLEADEKARNDREDADAAKRAFAATRLHRAMEEADGMARNPSSPPPIYLTPNKRPTKTTPFLKGIKKEGISACQGQGSSTKSYIPVTDAFNEIRIRRNARVKRISNRGVHLGTATALKDDEKARINGEEADTARHAFSAEKRRLTMERVDGMIVNPPPSPLPSFTPKGVTKTKPVLKGIKKKDISVGQGQGSSTAPQVARDQPKKSLVDYGSDED